MPAYNAERYIREAIESILNQTFSDFELIVINDGSTDGTLECIRSFGDERIKIINNKQNLGIIRSRNIGLQASRGEYIAKMDADDISLNTRLQRQVNYLDQHPEVAVIACKLAVMDESGHQHQPTNSRNPSENQLYWSTYGDDAGSNSESHWV